MSDCPANFFTVLLLSETKLVRLLQIQPEFGACAKPLPEPKRRFRAYPTLCRYDLVDAVVGYADLVA